MNESKLKSLWEWQRPTFWIIEGVAILAVVVFYMMNSGAAEVEVAAPTIPTVAVTTATEFSGGQSVSLIGNVRAFSEAAITSERAGRVVRVNVTLGQQVAAGQIIASLENASESAQVLQAQGSYDAALAGLEQSQFGNQQSQVGISEAATQLDTAKRTAASTVQSSYNLVEGALFNNIDQFFTNPDGMVPGLRISGQGFTSDVNARRVTFQSIMPPAEARARAVTVNSDLPSELASSRELLGEMINYLDVFITIFNQQEDFNKFSQAEVVGFGTAFNSVRGALIQQQSQIDGALAGLTRAQDAIKRSEITVTSSNSNAAQAQVTQALGSLRAAQANFAKTVLRTPVSGTVNSLGIKTGDFVGSFEEIAVVANNNALEVVVFVNNSELDLLNVGDTVTIEGEYEGRISQIAPAVDTQTRKTEVRIATEGIDIKNGDTVTVTKEIAEATTSAVIIPLTAVKFEISDGFIFTVEDNKLVQKPVVLGVVRGNSVEILEGLSASDTFVVDARGQLPGTAVTIIE